MDQPDPDTTTIDQEDVTMPHLAAPAPTRIDIGRRFDDRPTEPHRRTPAPLVSPPRAHTLGAAAFTPPHPAAPVATDGTDGTDGTDARVHDIVEQLNADADLIAAVRRGQRRSWFRWGRKGHARTVREEAARRAGQRLRHERHMEILESARGYLQVAILLGLLVLVVLAGVVAFGIMAGWFAWMPTHVQ